MYLIFGLTYWLHVTFVLHTLFTREAVVKWNVMCEFIRPLTGQTGHSQLMSVGLFVISWPNSIQTSVFVEKVGKTLIFLPTTLWCYWFGIRMGVFPVKNARNLQSSARRRLGNVSWPPVSTHNKLFKQKSTVGGWLGVKKCCDISCSALCNVLWTCRWFVFRWFLWFRICCQVLSVVQVHNWSFHSLY